MAVKYVVLLGDGMGDRPIEKLGGKTPLAAAATPHMDRIARMGSNGLLATLQEGLPFGSDIACLSILGYDPQKYYPGGRGPLEAAALGIPVAGNDLALRANLVYVADDAMADYSGGHISSEEAAQLIGALDDELGSDAFSLHPGVSYRHILVAHDAGVAPGDLIFSPPHDILDQPLEGHWVQGKSTAALHLATALNNLMRESKEILEVHPVNRKRMQDGLAPVNMVWLWGAGGAPNLPSFSERYGVEGSMISAVDLVRGIAKIIGLTAVQVPGATGYLDTNYEGKVEAALSALDSQDFAYLHVEAPDEASHEGSLEKKLQAIEDFDARVVGPVLAGLEDRGDPFRIAVLPDHYTPITVRTHTDEPVPFAVYDSENGGDGVEAFSEAAATGGSYGTRPGIDLLQLLFG